MDDVFSRVRTRVSENKARLAKVNDRTRLAQAKVNHIRGRKKATQVGTPYVNVALTVMLRMMSCY